MIIKRVIRPERLRQIPPSFSWVDHRLVSGHFIESPELVLSERFKRKQVQGSRFRVGKQVEVILVGGLAGPVPGGR